MRWDPAQYARFGEDRARPFADLVARVSALAPREVVDLGCGTGALTATLARRWPDARVHGIDSSAQMLAGMAERADRPANVSFEVADLRAWRPSPQTDVVVSNAALQWVPEHTRLISSWLSELPAGAWIAWQVPSNLDEPSHRLMREVADDRRWRHRLRNVARAPVPTPDEYARLLLARGWSADVWRTCYVHVLTGPDPVLEWVRGTGLRPFLQALDDQDAADFEDEYRRRLRRAYPTVDGRTLLPFPRTFAVGHRQ